MPMKTILVPTEAHDRMNAILESALLLARRFESYIEGFALQANVESFLAMDPAGGILLESLIQSADEASQQARGVFEGFMQSHGVAPVSSGGPSPSFGWLGERRAGDSLVGSYGRVFDIVVLGRPDANRDGPRMITLEAALFESGRPILIAPPEPPKRIGESVLIAWNCSTEQARTTAFAMPLLRRASRVNVLTVEGATVAGPTGEQLVRYLRLNGIAAEHASIAPGNRNPGQVILSEAERLGCDLVVKGAYTQSRLRQLVFGGATRHILANATLPVLMAH
jgi:nucleotide-binding universal stress UspA family protein